MAGVSEDAQNAVVRQLRSQLRVPSGLIFQPSDEYVFTMLVNRIRGRRYNAFVFDCDLYGKEEPWQIWDRFWPVYARLFSGISEGEQDLYFFTKLKRRHPTNVRLERTVGSGTWYGSNPGIKIAFGDGFGTMKMFSYKNPTSNQNGRWIMHEFSLPDKDDSWAICRIRKKASKEREVPSGGVVKNNTTPSELLDQIQRDSMELPSEGVENNTTPSELLGQIQRDSTEVPSEGVKNNTTPPELLDQIQRDSLELFALHPGIHKTDSGEGRNGEEVEVQPSLTNVDCVDTTLRL